MPALDFTPGGAAGHENAFTLVLSHAAQREVLEGVNRYRRNVAPAFDAARGFTAQLAKPLKGQVGLVLVRINFQRHGIEFPVAHAGAGKEIYQCSRYRLRLCE